jgi:2-keto-4-pentenoate hydratase/2-oxohepta-3-ene-1,7-dioic acid hydratase in catechol pathway
MHLVTFRRGRGQAKVGAVWHDAVLDLGGLAKELAAQRGAIRRGRGGFPKSMLELIQGGEASLALAREAWEYGRGLVDQQGLDDLARRKLAYPLKRVRLLAPIPAAGRNVFCLGRNYADHAAERGAAIPEHPVYFTKPATAVVGPGRSGGGSGRPTARVRPRSPHRRRRARAGLPPGRRRGLRRAG